MTTHNTKIADRIAKIIAHADSTGNAQEAEAFMAKAHAMLEEHGMSLLDVGRLHEDELGVSRDCAMYSMVEDSYRDMAFALALYYGCEATIGTRYVEGRRGRTVKRRAITLYGRESARTTFIVMWPYIKRCVARAGVELKALDQKAYGESFSRSVYMRHVANALASRLCRLRRSAEHARWKAGVASTGVNALVPVDLIEQLLPKGLPVAKPRAAVTTAEARKKAEDINLSKQVREDAANVKRIGVSK